MHKTFILLVQPSIGYFDIVSDIADRSKRIGLIEERVHCCADILEAIRQNRMELIRRQTVIQMQQHIKHQSIFYIHDGGSVVEIKDNIRRGSRIE